MTDTISALTAANACIVNDGQTLSLYARPAAEVIAELQALPVPGEDGAADAYSDWCSRTGVVLTTGHGDDLADILALADERGIRTIRWEPSRNAWVS